MGRRLGKVKPGAAIELGTDALRVRQQEVGAPAVLVALNDFHDLTEIEECLFAFERRYEQSAKTFEWKLTRADLALLMKRLARERHALMARGRVR